VIGSWREAPWRRVATTTLIAIFGAALVGFGLSDGPVLAQLIRLYRWSGGLIHPTLVASAIPLLLVLGMMVAYCRLNLRQVGWSRSHVWPAVLVTAVLWLAVQGSVAAAAALRGADPVLHPGWSAPGTTFVLGGVLAQAFGNALYEETVYRGFLYRQLYLATARRLSPAAALVLAALASQAIFALSHLPNRSFLLRAGVGQMIAEQVLLLAAGLFLLGVYLVTRNLFVAVGVHSLVNAPAPLFATTSEAGRGILLLLTVLLVGGFWYALRQREAVFRSTG
jgi:uncharacterized protein